MSLTEKASDDRTETIPRARTIVGWTLRLNVGNGGGGGYLHSATYNRALGLSLTWTPNRHSALVFQMRSTAFHISRAWAKGVRPVRVVRLVRRGPAR